MEQDVEARAWQAKTWAVTHLIRKNVIPASLDSEPRVVRGAWLEQQRTVNQEIVHKPSPDW
jgi:hypothetical protein